MLQYLILIFIFISAYAVLILIGLGRNPNEAVRLVAGFWKTIFIDLIDELFGKHTEQTTYPLIFGTDPGGNININEVAADFEKIYQVFEPGDIFFQTAKFYPEEKNIPKNVIYYYFPVRIEKIEDLEKIKKKIAMRVNGMVNDRLKEYGYFDVSSSPFHYCAFNSKDNPTLLKICFALTPKVWNISDRKNYNMLTSYSRRIKRHPLTSKPIGNPVSLRMTNIKTIWGFDEPALIEDNIPDPILLGLGSHPHALITGSSGSGKSQSLLFIIGRTLQILQENKIDIDFRIGDFKYSEDYQFLEEIAYPYYYKGFDCYKGIMDYYKDFSENRMNKNANKNQHHFLILDEYQATINYYTMYDKQHKTKYSSEILSAIAEILMLGRNTQAGVWHIWLVTQVASATLFANGTRENFMIVLAMGNLSKEQKGMVFPGQTLPDKRFKPGEGMLLADGMEIKEVIFPVISDVADWTMHIGKILMPDGTAFTL